MGVRHSPVRRGLTSLIPIHFTHRVVTRTYGMFRAQRFLVSIYKIGNYTHMVEKLVAVRAAHAS